MKSESESQKVSAVSDVAQSSAVSAIVLTFVVNAALGFGMSNVYDMLNSLQLMATVEYMNVFTPANVSSYYKFIIKMAEFDILPLDDIFSGIYDWLDIDLDSIILKE